jgi:hypothetical protein
MTAAQLTSFHICWGRPPASRSTSTLNHEKESKMDVVALSRLQFGLTALYHFLFVPLTLGLAILLVIMEVVYVTTGKSSGGKW